MPIGVNGTVNSYRAAVIAGQKAMRQCRALATFASDAGEAGHVGND